MRVGGAHPRPCGSMKWQSNTLIGHSHTRMSALPCQILCHCIANDTLTVMKRDKKKKVARRRRRLPKAGPFGKVEKVQKSEPGSKSPKVGDTVKKSKSRKVEKVAVSEG